jgi:uncharacterized protein YcbK (DUF882 family)
MHKKTHKISEHFSKKNFACNCGKCNNTIKISLGLIGALELLRSSANNRINILKGYACPETQENKKNFKKNYHTWGVAADITIDNLSLKQAYKLAQTIPEIKGLGLNLTKGHLHIDTRKEKEQTCWLVKNDTHIKLTPENQETYLE